MLCESSRVTKEERKQSNELQNKLARRRGLNGEGGVDQVSTPLQKENEIPTKNTSTSPKRKHETELDKKLTRRRILNGEGHKTERLSQFGGVANQSSPQKKKRTTIFNLEQRLVEEELFHVDFNMVSFTYDAIVESVKSALTLRGKRSADIIQFILNLSHLVRREITTQCNDAQMHGQDDLVPVLLNVFVRAMVGPGRIHLCLFDSILERDSSSTLTETDLTMISNMKSIADTAHNWLVVNHFIDLSPPVSGSVDVKIVMFGSYNAGKSSLIERHVSGTFSGNTAPTIGWDVQTKTTVIHGLECKAVVWDTAGQERYHAITENFLRGVDGVVVVYDACNESVVPEQERLQLKKLLRDDSVPTVLFGNKSDLLSAKCRDALLKKYRKKSHFIGSALTGEGVEDAFHFVTASALERKLADDMTETVSEEQGVTPAQSSTIRLGQAPSVQTPSSSSSSSVQSACCL
jgi:Ras-related protein Rab-11B